MASNKGLTIVEVLVAMFILSVALIIFSYLSGPIRMIQLAQAETRAAGFARGYLDLVRATWTNDSEFKSGKLPVQTPPDGFAYKVRVTDASTNTLINEYTYSASTPPPTTNHTSKLRLVSITVTNPRGLELKLDTEVVRSGLR